MYSPERQDVIEILIEKLIESQQEVGALKYKSKVDSRILGLKEKYKHLLNNPDPNHPSSKKDIYFIFELDMDDLNNRIEWNDER